MTGQLTRIVLISADSAFRDLVRDAVAGPSATIALELTVGFTDFGATQLEALRQAEPDMIVLDLSNGPDLGIRLAQFLADQNPNYRFLAAGPELAPDLLLQAMRAGVTDYLPKPVTRDALQAAFGRVAQKLGRGGAEGTRTPGRIYSVFTTKGGAGATVLATNLAIVIHRLTGKKTLLVDLDLELGEVAVVLGVQPRFHLVDFIENFRRMDAGLLAGYIEQHSSGVHLLSAPFQPEKAEAVTADQIRRILQFLRQHYDYIVVDTPRSFTPPTLAVLEQAELAFLVTTADIASLRNIQRVLPLLRRVLGRGEEQIRLLLNRFDPRDLISPKDVERTLGLDVYATVGNDYESVVGSVQEGKPIVLNGNSVYARDLKSLGAKITGLAPARSEPRGLRALFGAGRRSKGE
ncbi:MAG TPA: AAA family ATPase [Gemmatimonadales bacterium]|nr:AAA family ATPase [Gemmatimonadales bacterium]